MQLSTRARYGLRALLDIALHDNEKPVLLEDIKVRQQVSKPYLEQLLLVLQSVGLIRSIRGKKGGFVLNRPPAEIKLSEVVKALERTITLVECVNNPLVCRRTDRCATQELWRRLTKVIYQELDALTLNDLIQWQREKEKAEAMEFCVDLS